MIDFQNIHGYYLDTGDLFHRTYPDSDFSPYDVWMHYEGTDQHPYSIDSFLVPDDGFRTYGQFFLREPKGELRTLADPGNSRVISSPCDCGVFYLSTGHLIGQPDAWVLDKQQYELPGKMGDTFGLVESIPG